MTLLGKHFDTAFAAPDGIKKLRELILTLAMQGKLVPQDPDDQSASELLQEIEAEKKRLVKRWKIKAVSREDANNAKQFFKSRVSKRNIKARSKHRQRNDCSSFGRYYW